MKKNDIQRLYTQKVAELMAQGYQIHIDSMSGSQGELAHIDLCQGSEIIRILLEESRPDYTRDYGKVFTLTVGRWTKPFRDRFDTIWNNQLEPCFQIEFAKVGENFYTTREEGQRASAIRNHRWMLKHTCTDPELGEAFKLVALRWVRKQPGMKTCKLSEITRMTRYQKGGRVCYQITARGKELFLHA